MAESNVEYEKCKYCDKLTYAGREICGACMPKVLLVRELIKAGQELMSILDELEEKEIEKDSQKGGGDDGRGEMDQGLDGDVRLESEDQADRDDA